MLSDQQRKLAESNMPLVSFVLKRYMRLCHLDIASDYDDLFQIGALALTQAAYYYDPTRGAFSTFAIPCIEGALLRYRKSLNAHKRSANTGTRRLDAQIIAGDSESTTFGTLLPGADDVEARALGTVACDRAWSIINRKLPPYARRLLHLQLSGRSQIQIGKAIGKSQPQVSRELKAINHKLSNVRALLVEG